MVLMADTKEGASESRVIRVFLSSTFRDFMQERDLLVKQVFPELNRRARERGVEVVDVDLRWGITEEESRQGKVIPICLGEIDRCRPYFVGMLGERYGWIPLADQYSPEVIERQPWLKNHLGGVSVTELEILHGVLNDPAMAGRAFFYFRDPAWSAIQSEPGFVCETTEEATKLADLKQRICNSRFPVVQTIPDPKALADQIGQDLWELIDQQYPDLDEPDALEREERQHAAYRRSRLGVYLGGQRYIKKLEGLINSGQQKILISGESGAGKSALIANWIAAHQKLHPEDVIHAHHLGCCNDASAIWPLLARLIETAMQQLPEVYSYSLAVPQDWWELVAMVAETLQSLGRWAQEKKHRCFWVLDGLDRLDPDEQKVLPWLPLTIPEGVVIVASSLVCPAREILLERKFRVLNIGPLRMKEQEALIQQYLGRYTKQLIGQMRSKIVNHKLAGSPLFLRVLLEELRQCGRYETLADQLCGYLKAATIDDLYELVLERLEVDGNGENVRKVMTALWASRTGLSEEELLALTGLTPLQWAPIDLAFEEAISRHDNRLVFDHDYLRRAVEYRYLTCQAIRLKAHSEVADWFAAKEEWDEHKAEELPWQLLQANRERDLKMLLLDARSLYSLAEHLNEREVINYWRFSRGNEEKELDELIVKEVRDKISTHNGDREDQITFIDVIAGLLEEAGLHRQPLLDLRKLSHELNQGVDGKDETRQLISLSLLAKSYMNMGRYNEAEELFLRCLDAREQLHGREHPETLAAVGLLGILYWHKGDLDKAEVCQKRCLHGRERLLGLEHPSTLISLNNLALVYDRKGNHEQARSSYLQCLEVKEYVLGVAHPSTLSTTNNLGLLFLNTGDLEQAEALLNRCFQARADLLGLQHPNTLVTINNLGLLYSNRGDLEKAEANYKLSLQGRERLFGTAHPSTIQAIANLAALSTKKGDYVGAEVYYKHCLESSERLLGAQHIISTKTRFKLANLLSDQGRYKESIGLRRQELHITVMRDGRNAPSSLTCIHCLAEDLYWANELDESEKLYRESLTGRITALGDDDCATMASRFGLARCLSKQERYDEAIALRKVELAWCQTTDYVDVNSMLASMHALGCDLLAAGKIDEALDILQSCLSQRRKELGACDKKTILTLQKVVHALKMLGRKQEVLALSQEAQEALEAGLGENHPKVLSQLNVQAAIYEELGELAHAEALQRKSLARQEKTYGPHHEKTLHTVYKLAELLTAQERHAEAIPLRCRKLAWCREIEGKTHARTFDSLNSLAIDLREAGELQKAEVLFRELVAGRQQVLEPEDFQIGRALGGLAKTLELAGKFEEALHFSQQALNHRLSYEGSDAWWTNLERLDLARLLHQMGRQPEAIALLHELEDSMGRIDNPDVDDSQLISDAAELLRSIEENP
jgi:nephrocystin-3